MRRPPEPRLVVAGAGSAGITALFVVVLALHLGGVRVSDGYVDDLGELVAALCAAVACFVRSRHCDPSRRRAWFWLGLSAASWAAGEAVWSWYDLVLGVAIPFPSAADVGFLGACPAAMVGVLGFASRRSGRAARLRLLLDGLITAGSLLFISWATILGPTAQAEDGRFAQAVALAYPLADIATITVVLLVLMRAASDTRRTLIVIAVGLVALAVADSTFSYLEAVGAYGSGSPADAAWVAAYLLIATAAFTDHSAPAGRGATEAGELESLLPYLVIFPALLVALITLAVGHRLAGATQAEGIVVLMAVTVRQLVVIRQNGRLARALQRTVGELHARQDELRHLATHDSLTGLANREAVVARASASLARYDRHRRPMAALICDVDHFKQVNDLGGHPTGDRVLREVAARLLAVSRTGDLVGRLGGDEFVVVAEDLGGADAAAVLAARIVAAVGAAPVDGAAPVTISVGMALLDGDTADPVDYDDWLQRADLALYRAKADGRACWRDDRLPAASAPT